MSELNEAVIISAARTPVGKFLGSLKGFSAPELGSIVVRESVKRAGIKSEEVDEVIMGCVIQAGLGQNPARQAALRGGLSPSVAAVTVNKVCGSGLKAVMMAAQAVKLGDSEMVVAGGMESMSNAPYLIPKAREGYRLGNGELIDDQRRTVVRF
jgi:acetyl-CoA C-acetyltransferase